VSERRGNGLDTHTHTHTMCDYKSSVCQDALYDSDAAAKMRLPLLISDGKFAPSDLEC